MYDFSKERLEKIGAAITTAEIKQQPELWQETLTAFFEHQKEIELFFKKIAAESSRPVRIIFTGAGTSQYVGDTLVPYLNSYGDTEHYIFQSIGTTDIVAAPKDYLISEETTVLVSLARSGNSPESVAAVQIANQQVKNLYHLTITCAADGALAQNAKEDPRNLLLMMPEKANDQGFAMTGSFSCMLLTALLIFDQTDSSKKQHYVQTLIKLGQSVIERKEEIQQFTATDFERIVYLGSGSLSGLAREAQLKILELTAGEIATVFDSSMGFRHGPKSFINERTLVVVFVSNNPYTRQYDLDILAEIREDQIAQNVMAITQIPLITAGTEFAFDNSLTLLPEGYLALADIMVAQTIALFTSVKVGNTPDRPSKTGTVNRVVKGVKIHEYSQHENEAVL